MSLTVALKTNSSTAKRTPKIPSSGILIIGVALQPLLYILGRDVHTEKRVDLLSLTFAPVLYLRHSMEKRHPLGWGS